ncbi:hypothetical protein HMPREF9549_02993 [Escherichia coli MS 185-1]|nr:hypothetical protein HMPREF9549_02993 [Escherichia coli MS 185-1]
MCYPIPLFIKVCGLSLIAIILSEMTCSRHKILVNTTRIIKIFLS